MSKSPVAHSSIVKVNQGTALSADDLLAAEEPLEIRMGYGPADAREQVNISVTMRTPGNDFELALGFLYTEGIISNASDLTQIRYCTELNTLEHQGNIVRAELRPDLPFNFSSLQRNFYTTSSCGVCGKASIDAVKTVCPHPADQPLFAIAQEVICALPDTLRKEQNVFEHTGGLHASALFDLDGKLLLLREDVGRHNALDKLIGAAVGAPGLSLPLHKHILLLSGRASFELLQKAAMAGIQMVCAVGAPSSLAVQTAKEFNITLIGFLRENRFNIYSGKQRIAFHESL